MFAVGGGLFLSKNLFCYFMGVEMIVGKPAYEIVQSVSVLFGRGQVAALPS